MGDLVSIVVPVYNAEKSLIRTVKSLCDQNYKNIEIILVNDGSTDESLNECYRLANEDSRVSIINQKNSGPSGAKNKGVSVAKGIYITFVDADDYVDTRYIEMMITSLNNNCTELAITSYYKQYLNNGKVVIEEKKIETQSYKSNIPEEIFFSLIVKGIMNPNWNKLYVLKIIKDNHITFNLDLKLGEDLIFNLQYLKYNSGISIIGKPLIYYDYTGEDNLSKKDISNYYEIQIELYENLLEYARNSYSNSDVMVELLKKKFFIDTISYISASVKKKSKTFTMKRNQVRYILGNTVTKEIYNGIVLQNWKHRFICNLMRYNQSSLLVITLLFHRSKAGE